MGRIKAYVFLACMALFCNACAHLSLKNISHNGFIYQTIENPKGGLIHKATIDLTKYKLVLHLAKNPKLQTVSQVAKEQSALLAINAGFFALEGYPVGMLKVDGKLMSKPVKNRGVMGWTKNYDFYFDRLAKSHDNTSFISELQKETWWNQADNIVGGAPLLLYQGAILPIQSEGVLDSFVHNSYARTAVCLDKNQWFHFYVVDGGDSKSLQHGKGMSIPELAQFLHEQGCFHALNLDGGYSSAFVFKGEKMNQYNFDVAPERAVSSMLLVMPNKP